MRALLLLALATPLAMAQPRPEQPMDTHILQSPNLAYQFSTQTLGSVDGQRHYRLWIARPQRQAPAAGYPVVYLLDGNAALGALDANLLQQLSRGSAPVLVAVGYDTPLRIERTARTFDYTPQVAGAEQKDPLTGQPSGGADAFLDLLEQRIKPLVASGMPLDSQRQALWGHSYGGLLVLHALLTRPGEFQTYASASPSLWWGPAPLQAEAPGFAQRLGKQRAQLLLMRGDNEPGSPRAAPSGQPADSAARTLLSTLQPVKGLHTEYKTFPGLGHGPMLDTSLRYTLQWLEDHAPHPVGTDSSAKKTPLGT
ncbi:MAG: alpha/beta hydrolase [Pseudomonas sp.]|nr:alpha/beta hydrolase [Pseudomonas sp.]